MTDDWGELPKGRPCPFDAPRPEANQHWDLIAALSISTLYLDRNQSYRGYCLLIFDPRHVVRPDELSEEEWFFWCRDLRVAQRAVIDVLSPDRINLAMLGNVVPHLHWHIIPRYKNDPRWGKPIWTTMAREMVKTELAEDERHELVEKLRDAVMHFEKLTEQSPID